MARPKTGGRQIRVWLQRLDLLPTIREHMLRTVDQHGVGPSPDFRPTKGQLLDFALVLASRFGELLGADYMIVHKQKFLPQLSSMVNKHIGMLAEMDEDDRIEMLALWASGLSQAATVKTDTVLSTIRPGGHA